MLRRLTPFFATLIAMLLDTAVIPVFYHGVYTVPLTLAVAMSIGLIEGRLYGLLFGMIGGLLIDITAGTLGAMTFFFMIAGFLVGLLVDESADRQITGILFHLRRFGVSFVLTLLGEAIIAFYQYFVTASFEWFIVQNMLVRSGLTAALVVIFCPLLNRIFHRRRKRAAHRSGRGSKREVKHF